MILETELNGEPIEVYYTYTPESEPYRRGHPDGWDDGCPMGIEITVYRGGVEHEPEEHEIAVLMDLCIDHAEKEIDRMRPDPNPDFGI